MSEISQFAPRYVSKASDLELPVTIEYTRHRDNRGDLVKRVTIVGRRGRNLLTEDGDWLWWPTINHYNDVMIIPRDGNQ